MSVTTAQARTTLATLRVIIGASSLVAPSLSGKLFALDPDDNPQAAFLGRLFGVRNAAIGLTLLEGAPSEQDRWLRYGLAIEAVDVAALLAAYARGTISRRALVMIGCTAGLAAALGAAALGDD